jgi:hypothetical protein
MHDWRCVVLVVATGIGGALCPRPAGERHEAFSSVKYGYKSVQAIHIAESQYYARSSAYGDLTDLGPNHANLIAGQLASGDIGPYRLTLRLSPAGYSIKAIPKQSCTACPELISDQTMRIRSMPGK